MAVRTPDDAPEWSSPGRRPPSDPEWSFARRPRWLASHLFAAVVIAVCVIAGLWQLDRLDQRRERNERIEARALVDPIPVADIVAERPDALFPASEASFGTDLDHRAVSATGAFIQDEYVRVANRTLDGEAGDWVVALFRLDDGDLLAVNRGFIARDAATPPSPDGSVTIGGVLRASRTKGWIGADDDGVGRRMPRLSIADLAARIEADADLDGALVGVWMQQITVDGPPEPGSALRPIPLDDLDDGPHLGYAVQWFSFAVLGVVVYGLVLRRRSRRGPDGEIDGEFDDAPIEPTPGAAPRGGIPPGA